MSDMGGLVFFFPLFEYQDMPDARENIPGF